MEKRMLLGGAILAVIICAALLMVIAASPAGGSGGPYWRSLAGLANHACYRDGGVQQVFGPTGGGAGVSNETDAVCRDGWVVNISDAGWGS